MAITIPRWAAQDWMQHIPRASDWRQSVGSIDVRTLDDFGTAYTFSDQPFKSAADLEPYLTKRYIPDHYEPVGTPPEPTLHCKGKEKSRKWDVTVDYRITKPDRTDDISTRTSTQVSENIRSAIMRNQPMLVTSDTKVSHGRDIAYTFTYNTTKGDGTNTHRAQATAPNERSLL